MPKYTATFTCDQETWKKFKVWAHTINSSASEQLSNYMESCLIANLPQEKITNIETKIEETIKKVVDERLQDLINKRYVHAVQKQILPPISIKNMGYVDDQIPLEIDLETDRIVEEREAETKRQQELERNNQKTDRSQILKNLDTDNTDNTDNIDNTDNTDNTDKELKKSSTKRRRKPTQQTKYYSDLEVAELENLSRVTINRYRNKKRPPQDKTFFNRWKYNSKKQAWIKINIKSLK